MSYYNNQEIPNVCLSLRMEDVHMMNYNDYKKLINAMLSRLDESDLRFLVQIYTIVKKHLEKKGEH